MRNVNKNLKSRYCTVFSGGLLNWEKVRQEKLILVIAKCDKCVKGQHYIRAKYVVENENDFP